MEPKVFNWPHRLFTLNRLHCYHLKKKYPLMHCKYMYVLLSGSQEVSLFI